MPVVSFCSSTSLVSTENWSTLWVFFERMAYLLSSVHQWYPSSVGVMLTLYYYKVLDNPLPYFFSVHSHTATRRQSSLSIISFPRTTFLDPFSSIPPLSFYQTSPPPSLPHLLTVGLSDSPQFQDVAHQRRRLIRPDGVRPQGRLHQGPQPLPGYEPAERAAGPGGGERVVDGE